MPCKAHQQQESKAYDLGRQPEFLSLTKLDRVVKQREDSKTGKDILQPWENGTNPNPKFIKAYPQESKNYFTKEQLKDIS
jgi:hypothetical protein